MTDKTLPTEITPDNLLANYEPPSADEIERLMVTARIATRAMQLADQLPDADMSAYVSRDEAAAIKDELRGAIDKLEMLAMVLAAGFAALDKVLPI